MTALGPDTEAPLPAPRSDGKTNGAGTRRGAGVAARTTGGGPDEPTLLETGWRILRNRRWVILQALILIPAAVLALSLTQAKTYTATANLLFRSAQDSSLFPGVSGGVTDPARDFATSEQLVNLPVISTLTAKRLGGTWTGAAVHASVTVQASGDSDVAGIQAAASSPQDAARVANAYAQAYIDYRRQADRAQLQGAIRQVQQSLAALSSDQRPSSEAQRLTTRLNQLHYAQSLATGNAEIVQRAAPPAAASSPNVKRNLLLGILLAALIGFGLAALLEKLDRRLKTVEDLERAYNLPVISRIPRSDRLKGGELLLEDGAMSRSLEVEAFRILRANLRYFNFGRDIKSILVASAVQGDGKSTIAHHLAATMASMGDRVVLVEADLHKKGLVLDGPASVGLSGVLAGADVDDAMRDIELLTPAGDARRRLTILPSGRVPPNPSELLGSDRMLEVLHDLEALFDLVVIDSPQLSVVSDALALVPEVSGVVIVGGLGETTRDAALRLRKEIAFLGGRPLGLAANLVAADRRESYAAYHSG